MIVAMIILMEILVILMTKLTEETTNIISISKMSPFCVYYLVKKVLKNSLGKGNPPTPNFG